MAHIVIIGACISDLSLAYEMCDHARTNDKITVISNNPRLHVVPSTLWVDMNWRNREDIEIEFAPVLKRKLKRNKVNVIAARAKRVNPENNQLELDNGISVEYDFLVVASDPRQEFDEVLGIEANGRTRSICHVDHDMAAEEAWQALVKLLRPGI